MNRTGVEWAGFSWNPICGCLNGCPYCYARRQAKRHTGCPDCVSFTPHLHEERLTQPTPRQRPALIFAGSMCDFWSELVSPDWRQQVWNAMKLCPQHRFLALTKRPDRMGPPSIHRPPWSFDNLWLGVSVTCQEDLWRLDVLASWPDTGRRFVSFEPLLGPVELSDTQRQAVDWAIIGRQTGPGATYPEFGWVENLVSWLAFCPVFVKDNLRPASAHPHWPQQFPADLRAIREGRKSCMITKPLPVAKWSQEQCRQAILDDQRVAYWEVTNYPERDQRPPDKRVQAEFSGHGLYIVGFGKTHLQALRAACQQLQERTP